MGNLKPKVKVFFLLTCNEMGGGGGAGGVMDLDFYLVVLFGWNFMSHNLKDWDFLHDPGNLLWVRRIHLHCIWHQTWAIEL